MEAIRLVPPPGLVAAAAALPRPAAAGDPAGGRRADLIACELAVGGWPGRPPVDRPDLVLLSDPTGRHALDHAGSRVRLGTIHDFPVADPRTAGAGGGRAPWTGCSTTSAVSRTWAGRCAGASTSRCSPMGRSRPR